LSDPRRGEKNLVFRVATEEENAPALTLPRSTGRGDKIRSRR
jgi:hypothetical protein